MKCLFRPKLFEGESLTSYLQRFAKENEINPNLLWTRLKGSGNPQVSNASAIDWAPEKQINLSLLAEMSGLLIGDVVGMTFMNLLCKLGNRHNDLFRSRALKGLIESSRKFCPVCIKEKPYYKLIWQVKELVVCDIHQIKLVDRCPACNKRNPCLSKTSIIGYCLYCGASLSDAVIEQVPDDKFNQHDRLYRDWEFLLDSTTILTAENKDIAINLGIKKVYLDLEKPNYIKKFLIERGTTNDYILYRLVNQKEPERSNQTMTLAALLRTARNCCGSLEEFSQISVPQSFINDVYKLYSSKRKIEDYKCIAPWCKSYNTPGSLIRTASGKSSKYEGTEVDFANITYLFCNKCGVRYGLDKNDKLFERGYLIELGWEKVVPGIRAGITANQLAKTEGVYRNKIMNCVLYFIARGLVPDEIKKKYMPKGVNQEKIKHFKSLVERGYYKEDIKEKMALSSYQMVFYSSLPELTPVLLSRVRPKKKGVTEVDTGHLVEKAIESLLLQDKRVNIRSVASALAIKSEALKYWQAIPQIKEAAKRQKENKKNQEYLALREKVENIIIALKDEGELENRRVYEDLGSRALNIKSKFPGLYYYISAVVKDYKRYLKQEREKVFITQVDQIVRNKVEEGKNITILGVLADLGISYGSMHYYPQLKKVLYEIVM